VKEAGPLRRISLGGRGRRKDVAASAVGVGSGDRGPCLPSPGRRHRRGNDAAAEGASGVAKK
jgi:hypothetical protein